MAVEVSESAAAMIKNKTEGGGGVGAKGKRGAMKFCRLHEIPYFTSTCLAHKSISTPVSHLSLPSETEILRLRSPEQSRNKFAKWLFNLARSEARATAPPAAQWGHCRSSGAASERVSPPSCQLPDLSPPRPSAREQGWGCGWEGATRNVTSKMLCHFPFSPPALSP